MLLASRQYRRFGLGGHMFKVEAKRTPEGNYNVKASCEQGHTCFKKAGDTSSQYSCPHCGRNVY